MNLLKVGLLAGVAASLLIAPLAEAQQVNYNLSSTFSGLERPHHEACVLLQPKAGDYSRALTEQDKDVSTNNALACLQGVVIYDPTTGLPITSFGGGSGSSGAVYGPTAVGSTSVNPPIVNGYLDGTGKVAVVSVATPFPVNSAAETAALGNPTDAKCAATDTTSEALICLTKQVSYLTSLIQTSAASIATSAASIVTNTNASTTPVPVYAKDSGGTDATNTTLHSFNITPVLARPDHVTGTGIAVNTSTAATVNVIPTSGSTSIDLFDFSFNNSPAATTSLTVTVEFGTTSTCGTGTAVVWGPVVIAAGSGTNMTIRRSSASGAGMCVIYAGSGFIAGGSIGANQL